MPTGDNFDARRELLHLLLQTVKDDTYPSPTMLDMIEQMLAPDYVDVYAHILMEKISADTYPSMSLIARVRALDPS